MSGWRRTALVNSLLRSITGSPCWLIYSVWLIEIYSVWLIERSAAAKEPAAGGTSTLVSERSFKPPAADAHPSLTGTSAVTGNVEGARPRL